MHCWTTTWTCNHHGKRVGKVKGKSKGKEDQERSSLKPSTLAITTAIYWLYPSSHRNVRALSIQPKIPEISVRNGTDQFGSVRLEYLVTPLKVVHLTGPVISVGPTELSLSILTKLFSLVPLFCILLTRTITRRAVAWVGSVQTECTVPLGTWALTEFLLNGKHPKCRILIAH